MKIDVLNQALDRYVSRLNETRANEVYKWHATRHFTKTFDIGAASLAENIDDALGESGNLLRGGAWFPKGMLVRC